MEEQDIEQEQRAYTAQHAQLLTTYAGQYIAMRHGQVVDHDDNRAALSQRVRARFGRAPVLITPVLAQPQQTITARSPRLPDNSSWEACISIEAAAWHARSDADHAFYAGEYVAVLKGQVVDHDTDQRALAIRIRRQYPNTPVLITEAEARRSREFLILSPRFERIETANA